MMSATIKTPKRPHFDFLTLFPQTIEPWLTTSILGRAHHRGIFTFGVHQLRDYASGPHRAVDDTPYGGGGGMVFSLPPLVAAVEAIRSFRAPENVRIVCFSPRGRRLTQQLLEENRPSDPAHHFLLICAHYEGVDQRFLDEWVDLEVSLGDFVLTGGELPAIAFVDGLIRLERGTLADASSHEDESFSLKDPHTGERLLEHPHYTRPAEFRGLSVPDVLLSGDHKRIAQWRLEQARKITSFRRIKP